MNRRDFALIVAAALSSPLAARGAGTLRRVGYLTPATGAPDDELGGRETRALAGGLRELGWAEGRDIAIDRRLSGSSQERIRTNAKELVALNPNVILTVGGPSLAAVLAETRTIPIVFTVLGDPVGNGIVPNLAHPGGNVTGSASRRQRLPANGCSC